MENIDQWSWNAWKVCFDWGNPNIIGKISKSPETTSLAPSVGIKILWEYFTYSRVLDTWYPSINVYIHFTFIMLLCIQLWKLSRVYTSFVISLFLSCLSTPSSVGNEGIIALSGKIDINFFFLRDRAWVWERGERDRERRTEHPRKNLKLAPRSV